MKAINCNANSILVFLLLITVPVVYLAYSAVYTNINQKELSHQHLRNEHNTENIVTDDIDIKNSSGLLTSKPVMNVNNGVNNNFNSNNNNINNNNINVNNNLNNNIIINTDSFPDTLHYTSQDFMKQALNYGRYETQVIESEKESIRQQSQIMANHVKNSMKHFWNGYVKCAFGYDEVQPVTCKGRNNWGGIGMTIVDSLDTLLLMDLKDELFKAERWLMDNLDYNRVTQDLLVFEINIRVLGGLLSMYSLTRNDFYKNKAQELGNILIEGIYGFLPRRNVNLSQRKFCAETLINLVEAGSFQLEYNYLSKITGNPRYREKAHSVQKYLITHLKNGLIELNNIKCPKSVGAEADSTYEYFLKCWIQSGKTDLLLRDTFDKNKIAFKTYLARRSKSGILTVGKDGSPEMEHLSCFLPGLIALDAYHNNNKVLYNEDMEFAKSLAYTCYQMYMNQTIHLSPEIMRVYDDEIHITDPSYKQRPETVESLYILHEITGDPIFVKWGWDIYLAIENYTKTENGYSALDSVKIKGSLNNIAESYFPAETLKYLYLLFDTQHKIDLNRYVFNTEAHPFDI